MTEASAPAHPDLDLEFLAHDRLHAAWAVLNALGPGASPNEEHAAHEDLALALSWALLTSDGPDAATLPEDVREYQDWLTLNLARVKDTSLRASLAVLCSDARHCAPAIASGSRPSTFKSVSRASLSPEGHESLWDAVAARWQALASNVPDDLDASSLASAMHGLPRDHGARVDAHLAETIQALRDRSRVSLSAPPGTAQALHARHSIEECASWVFGEEWELRRHNVHLISHPRWPRPASLVTRHGEAYLFARAFASCGLEDAALLAHECAHIFQLLPLLERQKSTGTPLWTVTTFERERRGVRAEWDFLRSHGAAWNDASVHGFLRANVLVQGTLFACERALWDAARAARSAGEAMTGRAARAACARTCAIRFLDAGVLDSGTLLAAPFASACYVLAAAEAEARAPLR